jgi:hypothetical protein
VIARPCRSALTRAASRDPNKHSGPNRRFTARIASISAYAFISWLMMIEPFNRLTSGWPFAPGWGILE